MCAAGGRPSLEAVVRNWRNSDAPLWDKIGMTARNLWRRVALRQTCCGHHGQPGC
jgi:hypothetical protein